MRRCVLLLTALSIAAVSLLVLPALESDAETVDHGTWYFYGDNPTFYPTDSGSSSVTWVAECQFQDGTIETKTGDGKTFTLDISGYSSVVVTQTVEGGEPETATVTVIPLHLPQSGDSDRRYTVTYYDGSEVFSTAYVDSKTVVKSGDSHVLVPAAPVKDGYVFGGWFTDPGFDDGSRFDPTVPIPEDMAVYAKWTGAGSPGDSHVVVVHDRIAHTVSFETVNGLRYDVTSVSGNSVSFTVSVMDGFSADLSSIRVATDDGRILSPAGGVYTLSGISSDVLVGIDADMLYTVEYRLDGVVVSMEDRDVLPEATVPGGFEASFSAAKGYSEPSVSVYMNGKDITGSCVSDGTISISEVIGNLVIVGSAEKVSQFPWWIIAVIVVVVAAAVLVVWHYRREAMRS